MLVCEAFVGNVILKLYEGLSSTLVGVIKAGLMSNLKSKIGAALALPSLKNTLKAFDATEYGGAPLLGVNGAVIIGHGSSSHKAIYYAVKAGVAAATNDVTGLITRAIAAQAEEQKQK